MPVIYYLYQEPLPGEKPGAYERRQHLTGRRLLSYGLAGQYGLSAEAGLSYTDRGKPYLTDYPEIHFSISHCSGLVLCAFHSAPIGADAEKIGFFPEILPSRVFTEDELRLFSDRGTTPGSRAEWFYRLWTLKEAYVKMTGTGADTDLKAFSFTFSEKQESEVIVPCCSQADTFCCQRLLSSGHLISLCFTDPREPVRFEEAAECLE